ncbi:MAG: glycoside hydrolase family 9 protein [Gammaproteobacteria bacterium]|nr:glycoside hydrolase family 9 protein [Gammaproteobacteria bacterium]
MRTRSRIALAMALLLGSLQCLAAPDPGLTLKVTDSGYLDAPGVSVMLYDDNYSPIFFDQKDAAMQIILHGHRIATNGSVRLLPTPEQWDAIPHLISRQADKAHERLTAFVSYPAFHFYYHVVVAAEPGGVRVSMNLEKPLPQALIGRAGFNLELLPSIYMDKAYAVDGKAFGVFPRSPEAEMTVAPPRPGDPRSLGYVQQWHEAKGYTQPLPFATGKSITMAADDPLNRISVTSDTGPLLLFDGRNEAQNGWYVLRTLIPAGKTQGAVVWHIRPDYIPNWTRPPMIAHSQAGYAADFPKVAVIELDRRYEAPRTAAVLRLSDDGNYRKVFEGPVSTPKPWLRYDYAKFDFSAVKEPGLYVIEYAGRRTDVFPIAQDVYGKTWQTTLDGFLAVQMDHVSVRDAYRVWHGIAHMTDALQAPPNITHFDGYWMGPNTESPYQPGQHIPGLNVGGWFDAGDFDNDAFGQYGTIQNLALTYETFHTKWDELAVNEKARSVEMHGPDGIPDVVEQVEHGVLQTLAQIRAVGHPFTGIQSPALRWYTFIGDGASQTGAYSNNPDPRWAWTMTSARMEYAAAASLAAASRTLKGWNDPLSKQCLDAAIELWKDAEAHPDHDHRPGYLEGEGGYREFGLGSPEWSAAVELTIATRGAEPYKSRVEKMFPATPQQIAFGGWSAVRALPYLAPDYRTRLEAAVDAFVPQLNHYMAATPFGVPPSLGAWGGSAQVAEFGVAMYFLHEAFPDAVGPEYTLRAANYLLGTHPDSSVSYISGIGTASKLQAYGNNRADNTFVPGGMVPGYVVIKPDFPECITSFGFLWFEDEYTVDAAATWVLEANAADAIVREKAQSRSPRT